MTFRKLSISCGQDIPSGSRLATCSEAENHIELIREYGWIEKEQKGHRDLPVEKGKLPKSERSILRESRSLHGVPGERIGQKDQKIRLKNGYLDGSTGQVMNKYSPNIKFQLVTPSSSESDQPAVDPGHSHDILKPVDAYQELLEDDILIALTYACEHDHCQEVTELVKLGGGSILRSQTFRKSRGTVLHVCAEFGSVKTLGMLLQSQDIDTNVLDDSCYTSLQVAAMMGQTGVVDEFLGSDAGKTMLNSRGTLHTSTPLLLAVYHGHIKVCNLLLSTPGIEVKAETSVGYAVLHYASLGGHVDVVDKILEFSEGEELVKKVNSEGLTPLHIASSNGHTEICEKLLEKGASIESKDNFGSTPLMHALRKGHVAVAGMLTERCSEKALNEKDGRGETALHAAVRLAGKQGWGKDHDLDELPERMMRRGALVDARNNNGDTAFHIAVRKCDKGVVSYFLSRQKCTFLNKPKKWEEWVSMQDLSKQETALHMAARRCKSSRPERDCMIELLRAGAWPDIRNRAGETALHVAAKDGDVKVVGRRTWPWNVLSFNQSRISLKRK